MAILRVHERDFSGTELTGIDIIRFRAGFYEGFAIFKSDQFGPGLIENDVRIDGNTDAWERLTVNIVTGGSFSAAGWTFQRWNGQVIAFAWHDRAGAVIGSSAEDHIYPHAGADIIDGGGASDFVHFAQSLHARPGDLLTGGDDYDVLRINDAFRIDDPHVPVDEARKHLGVRVDLREGTVTSFEELRFLWGDDANGSTALFNGKTFSPDGVTRVRGGPGSDTIVVEAAGRSLDLSGVNLIDWGAGHDRIVLRGNGKGNALTGTTAEDWLNGRTGADTLVGGGGQDHIVVGKDSATDIIRVASPTDSSGSARDTVAGLHLDGEDRFELSVVPGAFASPVVGTLNEESFDADLAAALDEAALPAGQAVLFDPDAGTADYAGTVYLIVDANGVAGYQPGADYVFQLDGAAGALDPGDFI